MQNFERNIFFCNLVVPSVLKFFFLQASLPPTQSAAAGPFLHFEYATTAVDHHSSGSIPLARLGLNNNPPVIAQPTSSNNNNMFGSSSSINSAAAGGSMSGMSHSPVKRTPGHFPKASLVLGE